MNNEMSRTRNVIVSKNLLVTGIYRAEEQRPTEMTWASSVLGKECTVVEDGESAIVVLGWLVGKTQEVKSPMVPVPSL